MTELTQPTTRIPNLFHLLLLLALTGLGLFLAEGAIALVHPHSLQPALQSQRLQTLAEIAAYLIALTAANFLFPALWHRSFASGISWNPNRIRLWFIPLGLGLSFVVVAVESLLPMPADAPIEAMFKSPGVIWPLTLLGIVIAPLFEEIVFRGFLLPGLAIAFDYLRLKRSPDPLESLATLDRWRASTAFSRPALVFSSILTSILFALLHAPQLAFSWTHAATWPAVAILMLVSLVLCAVRIRTGSVAASTLVHAAYNSSVFLTLFISTGGYRHMDKL
jgi:membrane protease YdiL (CAAX protease family)